ncbi:hypothetical protein TNCV_2314601 [Trichonephila clavipes]|nr:hypothetical protein TNCV_2314601 [Trichonephila clavipes]
MLIWNQWVAESQTERRAGSPRSPMINVREDKYFVMSALQNRTITSRTIWKWACLQLARSYGAMTFAVV